MASIPIHNETDYTLTEAMTQEIIRDAEEHFGEEVHAIRVQAGLARHALNVRTREVRYAFSPQDFGFGQTMPIAPEPRTSEQPRARRRSSRSDAEPEATIIPAPFEDVEVEEDMEPLETSLESLDEERDDEEGNDDFFKLDNAVEDADEDDEDNIFDNEDDED